MQYLSYKISKSLATFVRFINKNYPECFAPMSIFRDWRDNSVTILLFLTMTTSVH